MRPLVLVAALCGAAITAALATPSASAAMNAQPSSGRARLTADELRYEMQLRKSLGFEDDAPYIQALAEDSSASSRDLGIPVSPSELIELQRRRTLAPKVNLVTTALADDPNFAGAWIDQEAGGVITVALTRLSGAEEGLVNSLPALSGDSGAVKFTAAHFSWSTLNFARSAFRPTFAGNPEINGLGVDVVNNWVEVDVTPDAPSSEVDDIQNERDGIFHVIRRALVHVVSNPPRDVASGRLFGGEEIAGYDNCTVSYSDMKSAYGETYSLTAAHCGKNGQPFARPWSNTPGSASAANDPGSAHHNAVQAGGGSTDCDCVAVGPLPSGFGTNQVLASNDAPYTYTNTQLPARNEIVYHSGAASYIKNGRLTSGTITNPGMDMKFAAPIFYEYGGVETIYDTAQSTAVAIAGDSGGPVGDGPSFLAILTASDNTFSYSSKIANVESAGLTPSFTS